MINNGYKKTHITPAYLINGTPQEVQSTIGLHVDDILMTCIDLNILESVVQLLIDDFEVLTVIRGDAKIYRHDSRFHSET